MTHFGRVFRSAGLLATLLLAVSCGRAAPGGGAAMDSRTLDVGGTPRYYELFVPPGAEGPMPLVLVFHGGLGRPALMARQTGFNEVAMAAGFAVAYPASIEHWNDGRSTTRGFGDDVAFARGLIDALVDEGIADPARVYATGASNGGMMTLRLACEASDVIAAFAPVIASFPVPYADQCDASGPVHIMMINGTQDRLIQWRGGNILKGRRRGVGGQVIPVRETLAYWLAHDGCTVEPDTQALADRADDGTRVYRERGADCERGSVVLLRVEGGGHTWPGTPASPSRIAGTVSQDIAATDMIWAFFEDKRLDN